MWAIIVAAAVMLGGGVWIGIVLAIAGMAILYFIAPGGASNLIVLPIAAHDMLFKFTWVAAPLYIFLGEIFVASGLSSRLYKSLGPLLDRFPGKLLLTNVFACGMFGAVSGSSMATAAAIGSIAYPELTERGYDRKAVVGSLAGSGTLGLLVPPSIILIIYGAWRDVSIRLLFIAAIVPAAIQLLLFVLYTSMLCTVRPSNVPPSRERVPLRHALVATTGIWPMAILMFSVIGTIYIGICTATEAAGVAVVVAIAMSVGFRTFSFRKLWHAAIETVKIQGMIAIILIGAMILTVAVAVLGLPRQVILLISSLNVHPAVLLCLIYLVYLMLGCFFEGMSMMLMTLPFVFPIVTAMGYDPIWLGVVMVIVTEAAMLTPPHGANLFVLTGITKGEVSIVEVMFAAAPYFLLLMVNLALLSLFPQLCMWLPSVAG